MSCKKIKTKPHFGAVALLSVIATTTLLNCKTRNALSEPNVAAKRSFPQDAAQLVDSLPMLAESFDYSSKKDRNFAVPDFKKLVEWMQTEADFFVEKNEFLKSANSVRAKGYGYKDVLMLSADFLEQVELSSNKGTKATPDQRRALRNRLLAFSEEGNRTFLFPITFPLDLQTKALMRATPFYAMEITLKDKEILGALKSPIQVALQDIMRISITRPIEELCLEKLMEKAALAKENYAFVTSKRIQNMKDLWQSANAAATESEKVLRQTLLVKVFFEGIYANPNLIGPKATGCFDKTPLEDLFLRTDRSNLLFGFKGHLTTGETDQAIGDALDWFAKGLQGVNFLDK